MTERSRALLVAERSRDVANSIQVAPSPFRARFGTVVGVVDPFSSREPRSAVTGRPVGRLPVPDGRTTTMDPHITAPRNGGRTAWTGWRVGYRSPVRETASTSRRIASGRPAIAGYRRPGAGSVPDRTRVTRPRSSVPDHQGMRLTHREEPRPAHHETCQYHRPIDGEYPDISESYSPPDSDTAHRREIRAEQS